MGKTIAALEITSSGVKLALGYNYQGRVYIKNALEVVGAKLEQGRITDEDAMVETLKKLFLSVGGKDKPVIESVVLGLPSIDLSIRQARSITNTTDPDSHVTLFDGSNCMAMITKKEADPEGKREVVDLVPYQYVLERDVSYPTFPTGKISNSLAMCVDVEMLDGLLVKSFVKCINRAGVRVEKQVLSANASIKYINSFQKSLSEFVFIDIGARLTTIGFSYGARLLKAETVNFGGDNITEAIAGRFGLTFEKAESYKKTYGLLKGPSFKYATKEGFSIDDLSACIQKALDPLVSRISSFNLTLEESARNLFVLSGGGSDLAGINNYLASQFQNRVVLFTPTCYGARDKAFTNCVSMIAYYDSYEIKTSPSRPVDLTLTRMMPTLDKNGDMQEAKEERPSHSDLGDEEL